MNSYRLYLVGALVGLSACSFINSKLGRGDASTPSNKASSMAGSAPVMADEKDSPDVKNKLGDLAYLEKLLKEKRWKDYAVESKRLNAYFMGGNGLKGEPKREKIVQRLGGLDASAFKTFPRLKALVGPGTRIFEGDVKENALEPLVVVLDACSDSKDIRSKDALEKAIAAYEKAIARVKKVDPNAFRFFGDTKSRYGGEDIPTALLACEGNIAAVESGFAEEYVEEKVPTTQTEVGCGSALFLADGVRTGPNRYASYTRTEGGASYPEKLDCKKLKKKKKYSAALAAAVKDYAAYVEIPAKDIVVVADGKPYVEEANSDGRLHRFQKLVAYSKKFRFAKNPCGGEKIFCEAGGSKSAMAFNRMEHALDRAEVHAGAKPELCKAHLKDAKSRADWFAELYAESKKDGSWISGATYKTKKGKKLKEAKLVSMFKEKGELADERLLGSYCDEPAKAPAVAKK